LNRPRALVGFRLGLPQDSQVEAAHERVRFTFAALAFLSVPLFLVAALQLFFCPGNACGEGPDGQGAQAPSPGGYTLNDLYDFIVSDGARVPVPGNHAILPTDAPGEPGTSMHTIERSWPS